MPDSKFIGGPDDFRPAPAVEGGADLVADAGDPPVELFEPDADGGEALARWYVQLLNALEVSGDADPARDIAESADEELDGTGWAISRGPHGWVAADESLVGDDHELSWSSFTGPRGGRGWRNSSGDIIYGDRPPGHGAAHGVRRQTARRVQHEEQQSQTTDGGEALARWYAQLLDALEAAGVPDAVRDIAESADEELDGTGWAVSRGPRGWVAADESLDDEDVEEPAEVELGPQHGVGDKWQGKSGRWFTKRRDGRTVPTRSPHAPAGKTKQRVAERAAKGDVDRAALAARLARHADAGAEGGPNAAQKAWAKSAARMFSRHHGAGAMHRVEELADTIEGALAKAPDDRTRAALKGKLAQLHLAMREVENPTPRRERQKAAPAPKTPGRVYNMAHADLYVDPKRFQYKLNTDSSGVTQELKSVRSWNPDFAGVLAVWEDPEDGKTYVVNGHHRHELAGRLGAENLAVRYVKAGSAREARAIGALINIAEGRGTAVDAAKFMRDAGVGIDELESRGVSLRGRVATDAAALTNLSDKQFDRLARGLLEEETALAVAKHLANHDLQDQLFRLLEKRQDEGKDLSKRVIEEMAREMAATPTQKKKGQDLFGDIEDEESLFVERNELKAFVRSELSRKMNDYLAVASRKRAERLKDTGNVFDVEENRKIAKHAEQYKNTYDQLVNLSGGISDEINSAAQEFAKAKTKRERDDIKQRTADAVHDAIREELGETEPAREGGGAGSGGTDAGGQPAAAGAADAGRGDTESAGLKGEKRWHVTPHADDIRKGGFGTGVGKGIGGPLSGQGISVWKDEKHAAKFHKEVQDLEDVRASASPLEDAERLTGVKMRSTDPMAKMYAKKLGRELTPSERGVIHVQSVNSPYIPAESFFVAGPKRKWEKLAASVKPGAKSKVSADREELYDPADLTIHGGEKAESAGANPEEPDTSWLRPGDAGGAKDLFTGTGYKPRVRTEEEKAVASVGDQLNAMARAGDDSGSVGGFAVERLPGAQNGMWAVTIAGKRYEGDQVQVANWIHAAKAEKPAGTQKAAQFKVGQNLTYTGKAGSDPAEFRGFHYHEGEKMARVIVRPANGPPYEISVKPSELSPV